MEKYSDKLVVSGGYLSIKDEPIHIIDGYYYIPGYSRYMITKEGELVERGTRYPITIKQKGDNYPKVDVFSDYLGYTAPTGIHRLLALAFLPIPNTGKKMEVDHVNHDRTDYRLENLEWVTKTENYIRGRQNSRPTVKTSLVYDKRRGVSGLFANVKAITRFTGLPEETVKFYFDTCLIYQDERFVIRTMDPEMTSGHKTPVCICDYVDGSVITAKSYNEAEVLTTISRATMYDCIIEGTDSTSRYIKGYRFFRVGEEPDVINKVSLGEAAYYTFVRIKVPFYGAASGGYLVHDKEKDIAYPYPNKKKLIGAVSKEPEWWKRYKIIPIYESKKSNKLTPEYSKFKDEFKGTYSLDTLDVFNIIE